MILGPFIQVKPSLPIQIEASFLAISILKVVKQKYRLLNKMMRDLQLLPKSKLSITRLLLKTKDLE